MNDGVPRKKAILIVDDEKNIRFTVAHALKSDDIEVDSAANGVEGLKKLREKVYDLLLVDLRMPGMTGLEMLRELQKMVVEIPPAVVITAFGIPEQLLEAASLGAIDSLRKPFSIQMIRSLASDIFERFEDDKSESAGTAAHYVRLAKRKLMRRRCDEARQLLQQAAQLDLGNAESHTLLGVCSLLNKSGREEAVWHFRTALGLDPSNKTASEYLAWLGRQ